MYDKFCSVLLLPLYDALMYVSIHTYLGMYVSSSKTAQNLSKFCSVLLLQLCDALMYVSIHTYVVMMQQVQVLTCDSAP